MQAGPKTFANTGGGGKLFMYKRKFAIVMSRGYFISGEFTRMMARERGVALVHKRYYANIKHSYVFQTLRYALEVRSILLLHTRLPVLIGRNVISRTDGSQQERTS
jgi:hypothetical protein